MSLIFTGNYHVTRVDVLQRLAEQENLLFLTGETAAKWYGSQTFLSSHVIRVPQETYHDIGVCKVAGMEDTYHLRYDQDSNILKDVVNRLGQRYQREMVDMELPEGCYVESEEYDSEGNLQLILAEN